MDTAWAAVDHDDHAFKTKHEFDDTSSPDLDFLDFHHEAELTQDILEHAYDDLDLAHETDSKAHHENAHDFHNRPEVRIHSGARLKCG